jgi:hypothetical protein
MCASKREIHPHPLLYLAASEQYYFSVATVAEGAGAVGAGAAGAAAVLGGAVGSALSSAAKSGSSNGPLVADIPGAGFVVGIAGRSAEGAGAGGWEAGAGDPVCFASVSKGASLAGV